MCSFNCAMSIILNITSPTSPERWKYINNLKILYFIKNGKFISDIKPAPNKYNLQKYGGIWSNEKFLEELQKLNVCKGIKDYYNLENAISEREKIISAVRNIIDTNKKTTRIIKEDIEDTEDDCVIYKGNRISLGKKNIWALNAANDTVDTASIDNTAINVANESLTDIKYLKIIKKEDTIIDISSNLKESVSNLKILDNNYFDFNQFLLDEFFSD